MQFKTTMLLTIHHCTPLNTDLAVVSWFAKNI